MKNKTASTALNQLGRNIARVLWLIVFVSGVIVLQQLFASVTVIAQNELATIISTLILFTLLVPLWKRFDNRLIER